MKKIIITLILCLIIVPVCHASELDRNTSYGMKLPSPRIGQLSLLGTFLTFTLESNFNLSLFPRFPDSYNYYNLSPQFTSGFKTIFQYKTGKYGILQINFPIGYFQDNFTLPVNGAIEKSTYTSKYSNFGAQLRIYLPEGILNKENYFEVNFMKNIPGVPPDKLIITQSNLNEDIEGKFSVNLIQFNFYQGLIYQYKGERKGEKSKEFGVFLMGKFSNEKHGDFDRVDFKSFGIGTIFRPIISKELIFREFSMFLNLDFSYLFTFFNTSSKDVTGLPLFENSSGNNTLSVTFSFIRPFLKDNIPYGNLTFRISFSGIYDPELKNTSGFDQPFTTQTTIYLSYTREIKL
ncbi:MAG: hypothetical protein ACE5JB_05480 [bacterium]